MDDKSKEAAISLIGTTALGVIGAAVGTLAVAPAIAVAAAAVAVGAAASCAIGGLPSDNKDSASSNGK